MTDRRIWVTQETAHDFTPAEKWGEVVFLTTDDDVSNIKNSIKNDELVNHIRHQLLKFDADTDYVCLTGSPYIGAIVMYLLGTRGVRFLRFLRWSNRDKEYGLVHLDMAKPFGSQL